MGMYAAIATVAGTGGIPPHFLVYYFNDRSARLLVFVFLFFFLLIIHLWHFVNCNIKFTVSLVFTKVQEQKDKLSIGNKISN